MKNFYSFHQKVRYFLLALFFVSFQEAVNGQEEKKYDKIIEKYASQYGVDRFLVKSLIFVSSGGNPKAVSLSGAVGLMQLMPGLVANLGIKNPYDPDENIRGGCRYLKTLISQFESSELVIAAFNAGPGEVKKYGKVPPHRETKEFVAEVISKYKSLQKEETADSEIFGSWVGTGRYTKYVSKTPLQVAIVGTTQPFDIQIDPYSSGVMVKTSKGIMGDPSLYRNLKIEKNSLHVEYNGPNPYGITIPNTETVNTMSYVLDVTFDEGALKGEFSSVVKSKVVYKIPNLDMPEGNAEIDYTLVLNLKRK